MIKFYFAIFFSDSLPKSFAGIIRNKNFFYSVGSYNNFKATPAKIEFIYHNINVKKNSDN